MSNVVEGPWTGTWVDPVERIKPTPQRERQIRKDAFYARLLSALLRNHRIIPPQAVGYHETDCLDQATIQMLMSKVKDNELDLLLDDLPTELMQSIQVVASPAPYHTLGEKLASVLNQRPERKTAPAAVFLPLTAREDLCVIASSFDSSQVRQKEVLIFNPWRDIGLTMEQCRRSVKLKARPAAGLVFLDCCAKPLGPEFPVYSMLKKPCRSVPRSECLICRQVAAGRSKAVPKF